MRKIIIGCSARTLKSAQHYSMNRKASSFAAIMLFTLVAILQVLEAYRFISMSSGVLTFSRWLFIASIYQQLEGEIFLLFHIHS